MDQFELAEALDNDAVYVDHTLLARMKYIMASVEAEKAVDFDFGATSHHRLFRIYLLLELAMEHMTQHVAYKDELRKRTENVKV